jgi:hypothetical protein
MSIRIVTVFSFGCLLSVAPLLTHHSVAAEFDSSTSIAIRGVVTKVQWINPHVRFWVDARNEDGSISNWELELPAPNALIRTGRWQFIKQGDDVSVSLWRVKDGSRLAHTLMAHTLTITLPDGEALHFPREWMAPMTRSNIPITP